MNTVPSRRGRKRKKRLLLILLLLLGGLFIYLVMVAQFQSLLSPFIVIFTIPLAFTGGLIALLIYGQQLSLLSIMGFAVLMGTVVNNGIVFVDYANQLRLGGMERRAALIATGKTRMRPILMTTLTTILAMVQMVFSDDMVGQMGGGMAIVIIGGLLYATLMTLIIVPVLYDIFFKRAPRVVDIGSENLDDVPDDAAEFIAQALAEQQAENPAN
jgi:HAE1 family hydrophobic/amphiphilic exporter-1